MCFHAASFQCIKFVLFKFLPNHIVYSFSLFCVVCARVCLYCFNVGCKRPLLYIANNRVSKRKQERIKNRQKLVHEFNIRKLLPTYIQEDKESNNAMAKAMRLLIVTECLTLLNG